MVKPVPHRPPRRLAAPERKSELLRHALPIFAARGYAGTTTRELAKAARITEPILYRHFASKTELFLAVLECAETRVLEALASILESARGAKGRLEALAEGLEPLLHELRLELRVLNGAASAEVEPAIAEAVKRIYARLAERLGAALAGSGLRRGLRSEHAGAFVLELGLGAALLRPLGVSVVTEESYGAQAKRLMLLALTGALR
ncbi:MAG: TetR/AcrR family transcriptional regulator [Planctomycetes bacterium]|nr:TetR/AcrR family transcriptional regulator [Planctomycetota bacterium]